jgi:hypothetical protein
MTTSIFSTLVNDDYSKGSLDIQAIERDMFGDAPGMPEDDKEKIMSRFLDTVGKLEKQTGLKMLDKQTTPPAPQHNIAARPAPSASIFDFDLDTPETKPRIIAGAKISKRMEEESDSDSDKDSDDDDDDNDSSYRGSLSSAIKRIHLNESPRGFGPREQRDSNQMIQDIDLFRHYLAESGENLTNIKEVNEHSSYADVERIHKLLSILYASKNYVNIFGDAIITTSSFLEYMFDGSLRVFGKFPINYRGLGRTMSHKFQTNRKVIGGAATKVATKMGVSPEWIVMADFLLPFVTTPVKNASNFSGGVNNSDSASVLGREI